MRAAEGAKHLLDIRGVNDEISRFNKACVHSPLVPGHRGMYGFSGQYERLQIVQSLMASDEAAFKDAFEYYDFVRADYLLKGSTNAVVRLFMTKLEGNLKLAGFVVIDYEANPKGNHEIVKFIYPESEDKARIRGRYMRKVN